MVFYSIFFLKNLVAWYFTRKLNSSSELLSDLRKEKRDVLDQVKNKETYKDAVEILQRFSGNERSFNSPLRIPLASSDVSMDQKAMVSTSTNMTPTIAFSSKTPNSRHVINVNSNTSLLKQRINTQQSPGIQKCSSIEKTADSLKPTISTINRMPYPIIDNTAKTVVDKMVDYLIGDGPSNRFAMICQQCFKHNGE